MRIIFVFLLLFYVIILLTSVVALINQSELVRNFTYTKNVSKENQTHKIFFIKCHQRIFINEKKKRTGKEKTNIFRHTNSNTQVEYPKYSIYETITLIGKFKLNLCSKEELICLFWVRELSVTHNKDDSAK